MTFQEFLKTKGITMYSLAKKSGVAKSTIQDIGSGKSSLLGCRCDTVYKLSKAIGCSMEELIQNGQMMNGVGTVQSAPSYLEKNLPEHLQKTIAAMEESWKRIDAGIEDVDWDIAWCALRSDINCYEAEKKITSEVAWFLRSKYLRLERKAFSK